MTNESEIHVHLRALDAALIANDPRAISRFFDDDWVAIGPEGATTKTQLIDNIASGALAHHSMHTVGEPRILVFGGTAVVAARRVSTGAWESVPYAADEWMTEVYVHRDGGWRCVITQKCPVAHAAG